MVNVAADDGLVIEDVSEIKRLRLIRKLIGDISPDQFLFDDGLGFLDDHLHRFIGFFGAEELAIVLLKEAASLVGQNTIEAGM